MRGRMVWLGRLPAGGGLWVTAGLLATGVAVLLVLNWGRLSDPPGPAGENLPPPGRRRQAVTTGGRVRRVGQKQQAAEGGPGAPAKCMCWWKAAGRVKTPLFSGRRFCRCRVPAGRVGLLAGECFSASDYEGSHTIDHLHPPDPLLPSYLLQCSSSKGRDRCAPQATPPSSSDTAMS